jgi:hypothetical protein
LPEHIEFTHSPQQDEFELQDQLELRLLPAEDSDDEINQSIDGFCQDKTDL